MLKPNPDMAPPRADQPVGALVHQLVEDGKAYARAEVGVVKALASAKARAVTIPAILFAVALLLASTALTALAVGVVMALATLVGPLAGGILGMVIFAGVAAGLAFIGYARLRRDL